MTPLTHQQALDISVDYQFLIGKPFSVRPEFAGAIVDSVEADYYNGNHCVFVIGESDGKDYKADIFKYLEEMEMPFDESKYYQSPTPDK